MRLGVQRRLAASLFKCSQKRVWFDDDRLSDIKEAITKQDIKGLASEGAIRLKPVKSSSRGRIRQQKRQKSKGLRKGVGSRKGGVKARLPKKKQWMSKIRIQRKFLKLLREKGHLKRNDYQNLYLKSKGGFFRSKRHIKIYAEEHKLLQKQPKSTAKK
jgi:large subunit ribosomal protein L19e